MLSTTAGEVSLTHLFEHIRTCIWKASEKAEHLCADLPHGHDAVRRLDQLVIPGAHHELEHANREETQAFTEWRFSNDNKLVL